MLPIAAAARRDGLRGILLPAASQRAAIVSGLDIVAVSSLADAVRALNDPAGFRSTHLPYRDPRARPTCPASCRATWQMFEDNCSRAVRSKSRRPAGTTCCWSDRRAPARR